MRVYIANINIDFFNTFYVHSACTNKLNIWTVKTTMGEGKIPDQLGNGSRAKMFHEDNSEQHKFRAT